MSWYLRSLSVVVLSAEALLLPFAALADGAPSLSSVPRIIVSANPPHFVEGAREIDTFKLKYMLNELKVDAYVLPAVDIEPQLPAGARSASLSQAQRRALLQSEFERQLREVVVALSPLPVYLTLRGFDLKAPAPFGHDYLSWLRALAPLSKKYSNFAGVLLDDFYGGWSAANGGPENPNPTFINAAYMSQLCDAAHASGSKLNLMPDIYCRNSDEKDNRNYPRLFADYLLSHPKLRSCFAGAFLWVQPVTSVKSPARISQCVTELKSRLESKKHPFQVVVGGYFQDIGRPGNRRYDVAHEDIKMTRNNFRRLSQVKGGLLPEAFVFMQLPHRRLNFRGRPRSEQLIANLDPEATPAQAYDEELFGDEMYRWLRGIGASKRNFYNFK